MTQKLGIKIRHSNEWSVGAFFEQLFFCVGAFFEQLSIYMYIYSFTLSVCVVHRVGVSVEVSVEVKC